MNTQERNDLVTLHMPKVKRVVRSLRLDKSIEDDCIQAGNLELIKHVDSFGQAMPSLERCIRTAALREKARLMSCGDVDINGLPEESPRHVVFNEEDEIRVGASTRSYAPTVNDDNVDMDGHVMRERIMEVVLRKSRFKPLDHKGKLAYENRQAMALGVLAGFSVLEMADRLGLSKSAAGRVYQKLVGELREELGESGRFPSTEPIGTRKGE